VSEAPSARDPGRRDDAAAGARVARLYEAHARAVLGLSRMLLRDPHEAEDATQAAFLAAYAALLRGAVPRDDAAWLFAIARNECRGRIRARMAAPLVGNEDALRSVAARVGDPAERGVDPGVRSALAALPARQREAVVLHDVLGLRAREVARLLGVTLPAVEALLFRARRRLRVRLRPLAGALTLPVALRDVLVQAIPGFADGSGGAGAAATGAAGLGLLAKLGSAPAAAKVTAATVAVTAAGTVAAAHRERAPDAPVPAREHVTPPRPATRTTGSRDDPQQHRTNAVPVSSVAAGSGNDHEAAGGRTHRSEDQGSDKADVAAGPVGGSGRGTESDRDVVTGHGGRNEREKLSGGGSGVDLPNDPSRPEHGGAADEPELEAPADDGAPSGDGGEAEGDHGSEVSSGSGSTSDETEPDDEGSSRSGSGSDGGDDGGHGGDDGSGDD
jgi:RNA polymerase sigma-70 factor (ECF subfamily)